MSLEKPTITALTPTQTAKILSAAYNRLITLEQVQQIVEDGQLLRADGTLSLIDYVAYLAKEVTHAHNPRAHD